MSRCPRQLRLVLIVLAVLMASCTGTGGTGEHTDGPSPPTELAEDPTVHEPLSTSLADGRPVADVPAGVKIDERPLLGAAVLDPEDPLVASCLAAADETPADPEKAYGYIGPWGASVAFGTDAADRRLAACDAVDVSAERADWCAITYAPWPDDEVLQERGGGLSMLCQHDYPLTTAFVSVPVPPGADWVLDDRSTHLVAYPVSDGRPVRIAGIVDASASPDRYTTHVVFVDADGRRMGEREVTGYVAG